MTFDVIQGDCLEVLSLFLADNSVDAIVCDPPYGLNFMGKKWDYDVPSVEIWRECLRVLKPGGHLLAFAGTRTQHRMAVNIEDAGFEIRDMIAWVYGSGFPKNKNLGDGFGSALKPALEPLTMARKPLVGTLERNWSEQGCGGLNIDGCRVETTADDPNHRAPSIGNGGANSMFGVGGHNGNLKDSGRFPANLIHDGSDEVTRLFPSPHGAGAQVSEREPSKKGMFGEFGGAGNRYGDKGSAARFFYAAKASKKDRGENNNHPTVKPTDLMAYLCRLVTPPKRRVTNPDGSTAFYIPVILDPFMGSGSTGKAAIREGFQFIGIEREAEYIEIAKARIAAALKVAA